MRPPRGAVSPSSSCTASTGRWISRGSATSASLPGSPTRKKEFSESLARAAMEARRRERRGKTGGKRDRRATEGEAEALEKCFGRPQAGAERGALGIAQERRQQARAGSDAQHARQHGQAAGNPAIAARQR